MLKVNSTNNLPSAVVLFLFKILLLVMWLQYQKKVLRGGNESYKNRSKYVVIDIGV